MYQNTVTFFLGFALFSTANVVSGQIAINGIQDNSRSGNRARILLQTTSEPAALVQFGMIHHDSTSSDLSVTPDSNSRIPETHPLPSIPKLEQEPKFLVLFTKESKEFFHRRLMFEQPGLELHGYPDRPLPGFFASGGNFFGDAFRYPLRVARGIGKQYQPTSD